MAKTEQLFWLGDGVKTIDGKDYDSTMPLPVGSIETADLKKMKADGRIGAKIAALDVGDKALKVLQDRIADLEAAECEECPVIQVALDAANEKITDLQDQLEDSGDGEKVAELELKIEELEKELDAATKPDKKDGK